jgi:hypothetical protein
MYCHRAEIGTDHSACKVLCPVERLRTEHEVRSHSFAGCRVQGATCAEGVESDNVNGTNGSWIGLARKPRLDFGVEKDKS